MPFHLRRVGGLVIQRHYRTKDALGEEYIKYESVVRVPTNVMGETVLVADLAIQEVWLPQAEALFDVRVIILIQTHYLMAATHPEKCYSLHIF